MITGRLYKNNELEQLDKLADLYGVKDIQRNIDTFGNIGMRGWWDPQKGVHGGLHLMNPIRGKFAVGILKGCKVSKNKPILDIGCGGGLLSEFIAKSGYKIIGVDLSRGAIEVAQEHAIKSRLNITYETGSVYDLKYPSGYFSAIICSDFLEHIQDLKGAMSEIGRVMTKNSPFVFDTISRDKETVRQFMVREKEGRIPPGTHDPKLFIKPNELERVARHCGIRILGDDRNLFGISIKTMEDFNDKFRLRNVSSASAVGHYLGFGVRV